MNYDMFIPITIFISIAFVLFFYLRYRFMERQALIEKGMGGEDLKNYLSKHQKGEIHGTNVAKWGILAISIGLAILIGRYFEDAVLVGLIFLFPGIGLLIYYQFFIKNKLTQDN